MRIRFETQLPILLFILLSTSIVAALPQVESAWAGVKEVYGQQDFGLRILREVMLVVIIGYALIEPRLRRGALSSGLSAFIAALAAYVLFEVGYALYLDLPWVVPFTGLRIFEYLPLAVIGFVASRLGQGSTVLIRFADYLRCFVVIQAILAIAESIWAPPLFGVSLFGGGRPFGTFVSPNLFGATMATCALIFALVPSRGKWVALSLFLALLSGSRTALISSLLVVYFKIYFATRGRDRWALIMPAPLLIVGLLFLVSSPLISGRDDAAPMQDGRIDLWQRVLSTHIDQPMDLLFGWGLGLSSNTVNVLFGAEHFPGQFDSDSLYLFLLNGYGLIGLLAYLLFLWITLLKSRHPWKAPVVTFIFFAGLPFNMWEYFPQNALLMFLWGSVLGTGFRPHHRQVRDYPITSGHLTPRSARP